MQKKKKKKPRRCHAHTLINVSPALMMMPSTWQISNPCYRRDHGSESTSLVSPEITSPAQGRRAVLRGNTLSSSASKQERFFPPDTSANCAPGWEAGPQRRERGPRVGAGPRRSRPSQGHKQTKVPPGSRIRQQMTPGSLDYEEESPK